MLRRDWLRRDLDTLDIMVLARNDAQSTYYLLLGFIALYAGEYTFLVAIYAVLLMTAIALSYGEMGSHFPETGGSYIYVKYSFGPTIGYISAWLLALDQLIMISYGTLDSAIYLKAILNMYYVDLGVPTVIVAAILSTLLFTVTLLGIRESARLALAIAILDILIVLPVILLFNALAGLKLEPPSFEWKGVEPASLLLALALASRGFTGLDSIGQLAGEARSPLVQVPRATFIIIVLMSFVSLSLTVILMNRVPYEALSGSPELALLLIAENTPYVGGVAVALVAANIILIMLSAALTGYVAFSRLVYMLSEEKLLPQWLAVVHPRFRTPYVALIVAYILSLLFMAPGELSFIVEVYAIASLANYLLVSMSLAFLERRGRLYGGFRSPRVLGLPITAVMGVVLISIGITLSLLERYHVAWILGPWLLLGLLLYVYCKSRCTGTP
jgi:APA family basic amino acid/polyamine antiporter